MLTCPYCHKECLVSSDCNDPWDNYEKTCPNCNKIFGFNVKWYPTFTEYELPCANGEDHNYTPIYDKSGHVVTEKICVYCGWGVDVINEKY